MNESSAVGSNWAGNYAYGATALHEPADVEELRRIVASAGDRSGRLRVLGSRHSFSDIADSAELISVRRWPIDLIVAADRQTVSFNAGASYGHVADALKVHGLAIHNLASLPHISVGGAVATATHGSGDGNGNLAAAVAALEFVTSTGDLVTVARGDDDFDGMVVGLGALGAVTRISLDVQPAFDVSQTVYQSLSWDALIDDFDAVSAAGYSVSIFTTWGLDAGDLWVKSRCDPEQEFLSDSPAELFGAPAASGDCHPIPGESAETCTAQQGEIGAWSDRLAHFRMGFVPSSGNEIQSEFLVPRRHAIAAIQAMRALAATIEPHLLIAEIRTIAADSLWMSPQFETDSIGFHFTWKPDAIAVLRVLRDVEAALRPFGARPHWGKVSLADAAEIRTLYPRHGEFVKLAQRLDPHGVFTNAWLQRCVLG